jgi:two-component system cell cycle sensor histidine kinase/response regulator CckA
VGSGLFDSTVTGEAQEAIEFMANVLESSTEYSDDLRRANERLAALIELGHQIAGERNPLFLLENFCDAARSIIGAKYAAIAVSDDDGQGLQHFLTSGIEPDVASAIGTTPTGRGLMGYLLKRGGSLRIANISDHESSAGFPENHPKMTSFLGAAISSSGGIYGSLYLADKLGMAEFSEEDERLATMLAAQVGIAYENAKRYEEIVCRAEELKQQVAERERAEEALRERSKQLQLALQVAGMGVWYWDLSNDSVKNIHADGPISGLPEGLSPTSRKQFYELIHPEDQPAVAERERSAAESHELYQAEFRVVLPHQSVRWVLALGQYSYDELGKPVMMLGVDVDITERKRLEEQFRHAQKMEAVGRLAGGIAHDFNNLLTAIIGYSQMALLRMNPEDSMRREIQEIETAGQRAASLTGQLLAFSRRQVIQPIVLNLNAVVNDLSKMLQRLIGEDVALINDLDRQLGLVKADRGQIEQIVMNLAINARDAMPAGGRLTIETSNVELPGESSGEALSLAPGRYAMLTMTDTGVGMESGTKSRIFEPFFTTKEKGKGTGLGLSTVYGIVKQSGGHIFVDSEPGRGTTFKLYLPNVDEVEGSRILDLREEPVKGTETILLVEDELAVRNLSSMVLRETGYAVLEASDGEEALELANRHDGKIDLLLTDVIMPGMSGKELSEQLKPKRPDMKVVFASGYTEDTILHHRVLDSREEFIQKPFTPTSLTKKLREVLGRKGQVSSLRV